MKKKWISFITLLGIMLIISACGKEKVQAVAIDEKTDTCDFCNMAVMNNQFATEIVLKNGKVMTFDDIGCMYKWLKDNKAESIAAKFVRDYNDKDWIEVKNATYVYNKEIKTPMAYNVISFKDKDQAEEFVSKNEGSKIIAANDLDNHDWVRNQDMMNKNKMMMKKHS